MRKLYFTQITDSRFDKDCKLILETRVNLLRNILLDNNLDVCNTEIYKVDFKNNYQYRVDFCIDKSDSNLTWNDVYRLINSIKAVPYTLK